MPINSLSHLLVGLVFLVIDSCSSFYSWVFVSCLLSADRSLPLLQPPLHFADCFLFCEARESAGATLTLDWSQKHERGCGRPEFQTQSFPLAFSGQRQVREQRRQTPSSGKNDRHALSGVDRQSTPRKMYSDFEFLRTYTFHPTVTPWWKRSHLSPGG